PRMRYSRPKRLPVLCKHFDSPGAAMRNFFRPVRTLLTALFMLLSISPGTLAAVDVEMLYRATAVITGNLEHEKLRGFAECLEQVLIKVSGDPDLAGTPEVVALAVRAAEFVD